MNPGGAATTDDTGLHADAVRVLSGWAPPDDEQRSLRDEYLTHLAERSDGLRRECLPAHVTASALVLDPVGRRVLLTLHPRVGRWLQLGGHCEPADRSLAHAALREAVEESGMPVLHEPPGPLRSGPLPSGPLRLDRHAVRCGPGGPDAAPAVHLDVQYLLEAPPGSDPRCGPESLALAWWPVDRLPAGADASVRALVSRALLVVDHRPLGC